MDDKYPDMTKLIAKEGHEIGNRSATPLRMSVVYSLVRTIAETFHMC
ncbi:hypothetical protein L1766_07995 [Thermovorax subterraneus]|nr:hypothetical protein [Thermovorax subterraneus]